jgi:lipopolysaccharide export system permease protein
MKLLDQYLIRKYLSTVFFVLLIVTMISAAIDVSDKVQSFISKPCTAKEILLMYYPGFMIHMTGLLMPIYTLIGVVFFTSRLAFNAEILSILNAGVSFQRLLKPYLIAGCIVGGLHLMINHFIAPVFNKSRLNFERTYIWSDQDKGKTSNVHILLEPQVKAYVRGYNKASKTASGLRLEYFEGNRVLSILDAESATFKKEPNHWELTNYTIRTFDGLRESFQKINVPLDTAINLEPRDFVYFNNQNEEMTTPELYEASARDLARGAFNKSYEIETHRRTADAATNIILTVIGLALAGRKVRGGMGLHIAMAVGIGALFVLLSKFASSFASSGTVPIAVGMWIPNLIFIGVAVFLVVKAQK